MESKRPLEGIPDLDDIPKHVFDVAVAEVSKLIESDVYPRYESLQCIVYVRRCYLGSWGGRRNSFANNSYPPHTPP
jgi:hypothetical protein